MALNSPNEPPLLTPSTKALLKQFDTAINQETIKNRRWLKVLINDFIAEPKPSISSDSNSRRMKLSPNEVLDYIFMRVVKDGKTFGTWDLWIYALLLNRSNIPRNDARFTRVKFMFSNVISYLGKHQAWPQDIAELEVIKNYLALHLKLKKNKPGTTLTSIESEIESTYSQIFSKREESPPQTWSNLVDILLSKTSFEEIHPPEKTEKDSSTPKFSLFLVNGKSVQIQSPTPAKRPHQWENVIEIRNPCDIRDAFAMFMEQFLLHIEDPSVTPGLMRSMILIIVDLVDVAIMFKFGTFPTLFGGIGCGENMAEPNLLSKGLFKLWVWLGVMSNPIHNRRENGNKSLLQLSGKLKRSADYLSDNRREAELNDLEERVANNDTATGSDFHSFLELLNKFYPRRGKKESTTVPWNELEEMYLNIRLDFGFPPSWFFNPHFVKPRLCATSGKYCSRLKTSRDSAIERMEVEEICTVCDSSSDEESEGHEQLGAI